MWYVIQVRTGTEESIRIQCEKQIPASVLEKCCLPYYERMRRYEGAWHKEQKLLFPGYLFLISDQLEGLYLNLKSVIGLTKLIGTGREIVPLTKEETELILRLAGEDELVEMSRGVIQEGKTVITDGPLKGLEGYIRKVDRHKRVAWLEIQMMGRTVETQVGVEVLRKEM
ncbi:MAG TPA: transcription antiterminator [Lachnospiraceae bacterium]|nr:transcription antiterminator [Lachnospiraceae bacterium]